MIHGNLDLRCWSMLNKEGEAVQREFFKDLNNAVHQGWVIKHLSRWAVARIAKHAQYCAKESSGQLAVPPQAPR